MKKSDKSAGSKLGRYIKAPIRFLRRARDFYVNSLTECSGRIHYDASAMGCPSGVAYTLPKSFSVNSSRSKEEEDVQQLIRAVSQRRQEEKNDAGGPIQTSRPEGLARSNTVGIWRIDEDQPCYFPDDFKLNSDSKMLYRRSRSYAVAKRRTGVLLSNQE